MLIIEDEPLIAMDLKSIVEDLGHHVVGVARAKHQALALAADWEPELILADIQLADGSSGIDAVNEILMNTTKPVVFITGHPGIYLGSAAEPTRAGLPAAEAVQPELRPRGGDARPCFSIAGRTPPRKAKRGARFAARSSLCPRHKRRRARRRAFFASDASSGETKHTRNQEREQCDNEDDLGRGHRRSGDAAETENRGDERDDKKSDSPAEHDNLHEEEREEALRALNAGSPRRFQALQRPISGAGPSGGSSVGGGSGSSLGPGGSMMSGGGSGNPIGAFGAGSSTGVGGLITSGGGGLGC